MSTWRGPVGVLCVAMALFPGAGNQLAAADESYPLTEYEANYLELFQAALQRNNAMSLDTFKTEFGPSAMYLTEGEWNFTRGDANGDRRLDLSDAVCVLKHLFAGAGRTCGNPACLDALDTNDSGTLDISDAVSVLQYLFGGGAPPPPPYGEFGKDPTGDALTCRSPYGQLGYEPLAAEYLDAIFNAYLPTVRQEDTFRTNGFVVYRNVKFDSMLRGFFEVYRRDLPVYISVDSILDALHLSFDRMLIHLEENVLFYELDAMLGAMEGGIEMLRRHALGVDIETELDDVAVWIGAARSLLAGQKVACVRSVDVRVHEILALIASESRQSVALFGATEKMDFSQFIPRGHYTRSVTLERYFRAMMWVQRTGLSFTKWPRHARLAYLLTMLLEDTGALERWSNVNAAVAALAGASDSLNPPGMKDFVVTGGFTLADLTDETRYASFVSRANSVGLGRQQINSQILMGNLGASSPTYDFTPIPPAFHVMGQRFVVDSFVFTNVVWDRVPMSAAGPRLMPSPLDAMFVLGNRAALPLLQSELQAWSYHPQLATLDWIVGSYDENFWRGNLYNVWLSALRTLNADTTSSRYPDVMRTTTWARRMLHAQLASWAHMRHDFVLYAKPSYGPDGCFYPTGWVDPYPEFYETIARFAESAENVFALSSAGGGWDGNYFANLKFVCNELAGIARAELEGRELSAEQSTFIAKGLTERGYGERPVDRIEPTWSVFDGWYPRIIYQVDRAGGEEFAPTIADVHTSAWTNQVLHVGVGYPLLCVISVATKCGVQAYAGPVLSYHEFVADDLKRWTDEEWKTLLESDEEAPRPAWAKEFIR